MLASGFISSWLLDRNKLQDVPCSRYLVEVHKSALKACKTTR
jgi:hypothetical protein